MITNLGSPVQAGWVVRELTQAAQQLGPILGVSEWKFSEWPDASKPDVQCWHRGQINHTWRAKTARGTLGKFEIELIEHLEGESAYGEWIAKHGPSIHHLMYRVPDVSNTINDFASMGVQMITAAGSTQHGVFRPRWAVLDTAGHLGINTEIVSIDGIG